MASDLIHHGTVAATAGTLTSANYVEDKVMNVVSPDSLLDYQLITTIAGGLSVRDIVFIITACITIRAALKVKDIKLRSLRRRKTDKKDGVDKL